MQIILCAGLSKIDNWWEELYGVWNGCDVSGWDITIHTTIMIDSQTNVLSISSSGRPRMLVVGIFVDNDTGTKGSKRFLFVSQTHHGVMHTQTIWGWIGHCKADSMWLLYGEDNNPTLWTDTGDLQHRVKQWSVPWRYEWTDIQHCINECGAVLCGTWYFALEVLASRLTRLGCLKYNY